MKTLVPTLDTTKWNAGNVDQYLVGSTDDGNSISGSVFLNNTGADSWDAGIYTNAVFLRSQAVTSTFDVVVNERFPGTMIGFVEDTFNNTDLTTDDNYHHIKEGIYIQNEVLQVRHSGNGSSDTSVTIASSSAGTQGYPNPVWIDETDTSLRIQISLQPAGGAVYTCYKDGDFTAPFVKYETTSNTTEKLRFGIFTLYDDSDGTPDSGNTYRGLIWDQLGIGGAPMQATRISGNSISTGLIQSTNYGSSAGSEFNLNAGTIKLGGSTDPKFKVDANGDVTASSALFTGQVKAQSFAEHIVIVTGTNSGSYFQTYNNGGALTRLIFDGSQAHPLTPYAYGDITLNLQLNVAPTASIGDIQLPLQSVGIYGGCNVIINCSGVTF
jgi:hypothetical protein